MVISLTVNATTIQSDTSAYQIQRLKINGLLAERSSRFGQYEQSLNARTGIFGFQTKNDIRNSNEILRQIVLNDNNIFKELKILMDYKEQEVKQVINTATSTNNRIQSYMLSIKKLQDQNQNLREQVQTFERGQPFYHYVIIFLVLALLTITYFFLRKIKIDRNRNSINKADVIKL